MAEDFQGGGDNSEAEEESSSRSEAESRSQSAEDDDESDGKEEYGDANEGQPESVEDRASGGGGEGSVAESTRAEDDEMVEFVDGWTTNRAKEVKRGQCAGRWSARTRRKRSFANNNPPLRAGRAPLRAGKVPKAKQVTRCLR